MEVPVLAQRFALLARESFDRVEEEIEALPFSDEQKSALWLYAWSAQDEAKRAETLAPLLRG